MSTSTGGNGGGVRIAFSAPPQVVEQGPDRISIEWIGVNRGSATAPAKTITDVVTVNDRALKLTLHQDLTPGSSYASAFPIARLLARGPNRVSLELDADGTRLGPTEERQWAATVDYGEDGTISVSP